MKTIIITMTLFMCLAVNGQNLYDIDNITLIEIEFSESNWDDILDQYYTNDLDERLVCSSFKLNGQNFDSVGVKFKGNSTYSATNGKNPLNIKLDYALNQDYQGYKTLKLSNGQKDPSFVREVLSYEIGRNYMDMPLSNYAKVMINGNYYGLFSSSESITGDYLERRFYANRNNIRFKCNPVSVFGSVSPSLEYLGTDSSLYFDGYELKSNYGWNALVELANQLSTNISNIESYLDVDRTLWMLAFNNVLVNLDSYTGPFQQNYYLVKDDNGRFLPIIWDLNQSIGSFSMITSGGGGGPTSLVDVTNMDLFLRENDNTFPLISMLLSVPRYKKMYVAHCKTMLDENFTNGDYASRALALQNYIIDEVSADPNANYTTTEFSSNLNNSVGGSGPPGPGNQSVYGVSEVMDGRVSYLSTVTEIMAAQPTITNIVTPTTVTPNSTITITADISNANYAYLGYRDYVGDVFTKIEMFDDGLHNDGSAADGVYGIDIAIGASDIQYYIYAENVNAGIFSPVRAEHEFYDLNIVGDVVINEIMTINNGTVADQNGEFDDWVELYNNSSVDVDLSGYFLSDDSLNMSKWIIPSGTMILANDYLIVWLDKDTLQSGLHANFKMSSSGETLYFSDASQALINQVQVPLMESSTTYGRYPNGTGSFIRMRATYSAENSYTALTVEENEMTNTLDVLVYPNPAVDYITIQTETEDVIDFIVYDLSGQVVTRGQINQTKMVDILNYTKGVYILSFPDLGLVKKIVKQ